MPPKKQQRGRPAATQSKKARVEHQATGLAMKKAGWDEDIDSDDVDDNDKESGSESLDESIDKRETAEQKRRRLAKEYLASLEKEKSSSDEDEDDANNLNSSGIVTSSNNRTISDRLRKNRLEAGGRYFRDLSTSASRNSNSIEMSPRHTLGGHDLSVTSVALSNDESFAISGSKDNGVFLWNVETQQRQVLKPKWCRGTHPDKQASNGEILSVAISSDGRYVVSGGRDNVIRVFDARAAQAEVKVMSGHRDAITSLAFRRDSYSLFSASLDRCVKHWDLSEMGYLETLFGHQDGVTAVDCWTKERPISASSDRTCRLWKVVDESHLVFRGHKSSADSVQLLTEDTFLTGGQEGALHLWKETQKKPIVSVASAHGLETGTNIPNWISSVASVKMSNLAASGSNDGFVRLWNAGASMDSKARQLQEIAAVPVEGFANAIAMSSRLLVVGTGREHRWGRWWCVPGNKNKVIILRFPTDLDTAVEGVNDDEESNMSSSDSSDIDDTDRDVEEQEESD